ncbi:MAG: DUF6178 family protein [Desulfosudaceae bacterium]
MMDIQKKLTQVTDLKEQALRLPPDKAHEFIISSPDAPAIVHAMAEQDFHCLVNEIGPGDSLELLALATDSQWEYILDVEAWQQERLAVAPVIRWFDLFMQADAERFINWISTTKKDFLELFLYYNVEAGICDDDQNPSEFDDDFFTFDDLFFLRFIKTGREVLPPDETTAGYRDQVLYDFMKRMAGGDDPQPFRDLLFYSTAVIPAEAEEEAYRLRNVRLAEKGFLPFDEAIGIYQPVSDPGRLPKKETSDSSPALNMPVPLTPTTTMDESMLFARALELIDSSEAWRGLQAELVALCNRIAVADQALIREKSSLGAVVRKACGYIGLGLTELAGTEEQLDPDPARVVAALKENFLADIFRIGYNQAVALKKRADRWYRDSWFRQCSLPVSFWGDTAQATLSGLLVKRPLFYDVNLEGGRYREFENPADLLTTTKVLDRLMVIDDLLGQTTVDPTPVSFEVLTYKNLLLTLWARDCLGLPPIVDFIEMESFRTFYGDLLSAAPAAKDDFADALDASSRREIKDYWKQMFLDWLAMITGQSAYHISQRAGSVLEDLFEEIEETFGRVTPDDLDPRYVELFLVC